MPTAIFRGVLHLCLCSKLLFTQALQKRGHGPTNIYDGGFCKGFAKKLTTKKRITIIAKLSILDACGDPGYVSAIYKIIGNKAKGRISKGVLQENKTRQIFRKKKISYPPDTYTQVCVLGDKKCLFFGKFSVLCFLVTPVLGFALLPYYRRNILLV